MFRPVHLLRLPEEVADGPPEPVLPLGQELQKVLDAGLLHGPAERRHRVGIDGEVALLLVPDGRGA
eukprot:3768763-Alexandrium_andersonii.AAC.1